MRRTHYPIHPDFHRFEHLNPPLNPFLLPLLQKLLNTLFTAQKPSSELLVSRLTVPGEREVPIRALLFSPIGLKQPAPCLLYYHGGGFVFPAAPHHYSLIKEYAKGARCKVLMVDYRLAPKHPFPTAPEDCFAAYAWLLGQAGNLGVDLDAIAVGGDSAGGQLATVVCLMAKERSLAQPCGQMLIYPVTGHKTDTGTMREYTDTPLCNSLDISIYERLYHQQAAPGKAEYADPLHAPSLKELPPAYLETAEFDCLRDEGILYAQRLRDFGVDVELHQTQGTIHGFDAVLNSPIVRTCVNQRIRFLARVFSTEQSPQT